MEKGLCNPQGEDPWRVLEFYSGIGGMVLSLSLSLHMCRCIYVFVIISVYLCVYVSIEILFKEGRCECENCGSIRHQQHCQRCLSTQFRSPPLPGLQKHSGDARAFSFLKILELIQHTLHPPLILFVENVVGFETSDTHEKMIEILSKTGFVTQEFILSPIQFGVPYSRPRYFCLAKRKPSSFENQLFNNQLLSTPSPLFGHEDDSLIDEHDQSEKIWDKLLQSCEPVERFLEFKNTINPLETESSYLETLSVSTDASGELENNERDRSDSNSWDQFSVPLSLIERWGSAMDIVYPDSKRCCCFTKSYYRYVKGTGSLLATGQSKKDKVSSLEEQCLRYFTPREVANLHSFPEDFHFPQHVNLRQRYALLGNSLSVAVVAPLLAYLFTQPSGL